MKPGHDVEVIPKGMVASRVMAIEGLGRCSEATMCEMVPDDKARTANDERCQANAAIFSWIKLECT